MSNWKVKSLYLYSHSSLGEFGSYRLTEFTSFELRKQNELPWEKVQIPFSDGGWVKRQGAQWESAPGQINCCFGWDPIIFVPQEALHPALKQFNRCVSIVSGCTPELAKRGWGGVRAITQGGHAPYLQVTTRGPFYYIPPTIQSTSVHLANHLIWWVFHPLHITLGNKLRFFIEENLPLILFRANLVQRLW